MWCCGDQASCRNKDCVCRCHVENTVIDTRPDTRPDPCYECGSPLGTHTPDCVYTRLALVEQELAEKHIAPPVDVVSAQLVEDLGVVIGTAAQPQELFFLMERVVKKRLHGTFANLVQSRDFWRRKYSEQCTLYHDAAYGPRAKALAEVAKAARAMLTDRDAGLTLKLFDAITELDKTGIR